MISTNKAPFLQIINFKKLV